MKKQCGVACHVRCTRLNLLLCDCGGMQTIYFRMCNAQLVNHVHGCGPFACGYGQSEPKSVLAAAEQGIVKLRLACRLDGEEGNWCGIEHAQAIGMQGDGRRLELRLKRDLVGCSLRKLPHRKLSIQSSKLSELVKVLFDTEMQSRTEGGAKAETPRRMCRDNNAYSKVSR